MIVPNTGRSLPHFIEISDPRIQAEPYTYYMLNGHKVWVIAVSGGSVYFERCNADGKSRVMTIGDFEHAASVS